MAGKNEVKKKEKTEEQMLIEQYFKDNEILLKSMRKLFFGMDLLDDEKAHIKATFEDKKLAEFVRRRFLPSYTDDAPIGGTTDVWLGVEEMCFGKHPDEILQAVSYKEQALDMTRKALALLQNPDGEKVNLDYSPKMYVNDPLQINLLARNMYLRHIDKQLTFLYVIAHADTIDMKELQARMKQNSSQ